MANLAVQLARDVLEMQRTIDLQEREITRLQRIEEQYHELLDSSLAHSQKMVGGLLALTATPGVMEALEANRQT